MGRDEKVQKKWLGPLETQEKYGNIYCFMSIQIKCYKFLDVWFKNNKEYSNVERFWMSDILLFGRVRSRSWGKFVWKKRNEKSRGEIEWLKEKKVQILQKKY